MGNQHNDWDDEDDDLDFEEEVKPRREDNDVLRQVRKAARAAEKRAKELEAELATLKTQQRSSLVSSFLSEKGLNPKIAKFIPSDVETSAESLANWLEDNGDLFGITVSRQEEPQDLSALQQIDKVTSTAQVQAGIEDVMSRLNQAASADEIISMIYSSNQ